MGCKIDLEFGTTWGCSQTGPVAGRSRGSADSAHPPLCTSSPATAQTHSRPGVCPDSPDPGRNRLACSRCLSHRSWASCSVLPKHTSEAARGVGGPSVLLDTTAQSEEPLASSRTGAPGALHLHTSLSPLLPFGPTSLFSYAPFDSSAGRAEDCRLDKCGHP